jgi:hypothetical protein
MVVRKYPKEGNFSSFRAADGNKRGFAAGGCRTS